MNECEPLKMSRRHFVQVAFATLGVGALSLTIGYPGITSADTPLIGDYPPKSTSQIKILGGGSEPLPSLPEKEKDNRSWYKIETTLKPPRSYRSAICWSEGLNGFLMHGGFSYDANHNETWLFRENKWSKLEQGSTPFLHGHKIVDTPLGVIMFGGVIKLPNGTYGTSNQFFIYNENQITWENLTPKWESARPVPSLQAMGMVYNPKTRSVWIMGGGVGNPVEVSDVTYELFLPGAWDSIDDWYLRGMGYRGYFNYLPIFEPLAYCIPDDQATYLYGGLGPDGLGNVLPSTKSYRIINIDHDIQIEPSGLTEVDYGGTLRGGYDQKRQELILHSGAPMNFWMPPYRETIEFKMTDLSWYRIKSPTNPPVYDKPAVAINTAGEMLRFGGSYYNLNHQPQFSNETWLLKPIYRAYLPLTQKG